MIASLLLVVGLIVLFPASVAAHPLGNFSVNRYSRIEIGRDQVRLRYALDLAEIPTLQELRAAGFAGRPSQSESDQFLQAKASQLAAGARLALNGSQVVWSIEGASLSFVPGQADLDTLRIVATFAAPVLGIDGAQFVYRDGNYPGRAGWHEVVLRGVDGISLEGASAPDQDLTQELQSYPEDATRAPLDVSAASATLRWASGSSSSLPTVVRSSAAQPSSTDGGAPGSRPLGLDPAANHLAPFLRGSDGGVGTLLMALAVAMGLGALHALEPGHGKTLVGGYLVGSRGTPMQAVLLGLSVTATHTVGVYALGLVTLVAAQYILPERLYPVLGALSGLLLAAIGLSLARSRLSQLVSRRSIADQHNDHGEHEYGHHHHGEHDHDHEEEVHSHHYGHDHGYAREPGRHLHVQFGPAPVGGRASAGNILALGVSGGLLPCPSALIVLLAAISMQNVALGMALVVAFSLGLACVLTALGLLVVYTRNVVGGSRLGERARELPLLRAVPAASAVVITVAGLVIAAQAAHTLTL